MGIVYSSGNPKTWQRHDNSTTNTARYHPIYENMTLTAFLSEILPKVSEVEIRNNKIYRIIQD
jgi:hypothetical protein